MPGMSAESLVLKSILCWRRHAPPSAPCRQPFFPLQLRFRTVQTTYGCRLSLLVDHDAMRGVALPRRRGKLVLHLSFGCEVGEAREEDMEHATLDDAERHDEEKDDVRSLGSYRQVATLVVTMASTTEDCYAGSHLGRLLGCVSSVCDSPSIQFILV
jgi:hypothetical protein